MMPSTDTTMPRSARFRVFGYSDLDERSIEGGVRRLCPAVSKLRPSDRPA